MYPQIGSLPASAEEGRSFLQERLAFLSKVLFLIVLGFYSSGNLAALPLRGQDAFDVGTVVPPDLEPFVLSAAVEQPEALRQELQRLDLVPAADADYLVVVGMTVAGGDVPAHDIPALEGRCGLG